MGKKQMLLFTEAETAEKRLEELIDHNSAETITQNPQNSYYSIKGGNLRLYPDGYEVMFNNSSSGLLYLRNINVIVWYNMKKEREQQTGIIDGGKE